MTDQGGADGEWSQGGAEGLTEVESGALRPEVQQGNLPHRAELGIRKPEVGLES